MVDLAAMVTAIESVDLDVHVVRLVSVGELVAVLEVTGLTLVLCFPFPSNSPSFFKPCRLLVGVKCSLYIRGMYITYLFPIFAYICSFTVGLFILVSV